MDRSFFRYEDPYELPRRKTNLFAWTIAILLLTGLALATWLGSFYIFGQPERPDSYRILKKLNKLEQPKRFQLTAAPSGEFLRPKELFSRYSAMRPAELARANAELTRNYIRNYQHMAGQVPYVVGRFVIMDARELTSEDVFTSGMVALATAAEAGEVLLEHVYPADEQTVPALRQTLATGLEIKLERLHDLSAVIHAERLADGRMLFTAVPLLYGSYTVLQGRGTFSLEPPLDLNMAGGWPLFKQPARLAAEQIYARYREKVAPSAPVVGIPGILPSATPAVAANELVRVEAAMPVETPLPSKVAADKTKPGGSPAAAPSPAKAVAAGATPAPTVVPGQALASTAGGGTWRTYPAGKMPVGRLITTADLDDVAARGMSGERIYLRGQFVVNFAEANRAVMRPKSTMTEQVLRLGSPSSTRIIVEFPQGRTPPEQGAVVTRNEARPFEVTEVRKQADGQLNVFVREIMEP